MKSRVSEKKPVALVTGGLRGIGLGISRRLAYEGYDLSVCGIRPHGAVKTALASLEACGADVLYVRADVGKSDDRERLIECIRTHFGRLHVLVNNAGVAPRRRVDMLDATEESFDEVMNINCKGAHFLTRLAARWMISQVKHDGAYKAAIVNITSVSALVGSTNRGEYCISKAGQSMSGMLWAIRLGEFGIPVYEIRPGIIETDMTAGVKEKYDRLIGEGLLVQPRWGKPDDIGKAVAALVRGDFAYSTGQVIRIDGGLMLRRL